MKRILSILLTLSLGATLLAACGGVKGSGTPTPGTSGTPSAPSFDQEKSIAVVSREGGSGTRGAFIELFGIEKKGADGTKKDMTTVEAVIAKATDVMMTNVASDKYAIGYISLGSLNNTVKAVKIEGVEASAENVKNGTYPISRPFNIATKGEATGLAKDFIDYILSAEGQAVVAKSYISINSSAPAYVGSKPSGKIVVAGSSSVTPVMEKLKEAYLALNPNAQIEIQQSDSSAGMTAAMSGTCDIGMASRALKDTEKAALNSMPIALDGIAVIVNKENPISNLTKDQVNKIYTSDTLKWSEAAK